MGPELRTNVGKLTRVNPDPQGSAIPPETMLVAESNLFPVIYSGEAHWTVEAALAGAGEARIGIVSWDSAGSSPYYTATDWVTLKDNAVPTTFRYQRGLVSLPDRVFTGCFRIEYRGGDALWIDNCMVDPNAGQLGYFDGNWHEGQAGDFGWYGGGQYANTSYSVYYPARGNLGTYLFGYNEEGPRSGSLEDIKLTTLSDPAPEKIVDIYWPLRAVRDKILSEGLPAVTVVNGGIPVGQVSLNDVSEITRHPGESARWVPGGVSQVIPQWEDIYHLRTPAWLGGLYIPVKAYPGFDPVSQP